MAKILTKRTVIPEGTDEWRSLMGAIFEILFIIVPLVVLTIIHLSRGQSAGYLLASPEWSFGTAILFGQALVRFVSGVFHGGVDADFHWETFGLLVAGLVVVGLVPSLIILTLVLTVDPVPIGLVWAQIALFIVSVITYLYLGSVGHYGLHYVDAGGQAGRGRVVASEGDEVGLPGTGRNTHPAVQSTKY